MAPVFGLSFPALSISLPSLQPLIDLFPPFLLAVPKKKVSHSRKSMRAANKGLEDKTRELITFLLTSWYLLRIWSYTDIVACPACGGPKLAHHLCPSCYSSMSRAWKAANKDIVEVEMGDEAIAPASR